jgi:histidine triad (HIT) family protein
VTTDCIFCRIVAGTAAASIVYDDALTMAFVDMRQPIPGHVLVVPKTHVREILALDDVTGAAIMSTVARVARAVQAAFAPDGMNIFQSNGEAAGQEVFHFHMHVLPRRTGDGLLRMYDASPEMPPRDELDELAAALRAAIS